MNTTNSNWADFRKEAYTESYTEAYVKAYTDGLVLGYAKMIKLMLKNGMSKEEIATQTGFSEENINKFLAKSAQLADNQLKRAQEVSRWTL